MLLAFYSILFLGILLFPFAFFVWKYREGKDSLFGAAEREDLLHLQEEKTVLLSNLADLKADEETGKLSGGEFQTLAASILLELDRIDQKISKLQTQEIQENLRICPSCGTKRIENARFCHNCGYRFF